MENSPRSIAYTFLSYKYNEARPSENASCRRVPQHYKHQTHQFVDIMYTDLNIGMLIWE